MARERPRQPKATDPGVRRIRKLEARVGELDRYVAALTRDSYDAIVGVDVDGTIRSWNRGAWVIFGWEPEEIVGKSYRLLMPRDHDAPADFARMIAALSRRGFVNDTEAVRVTKDGRRVIVSVTRTALKDAQGKLIGFSAIMRDITEKRRMEQRLIHGERMAAFGELAAILAHEIKNPLNSMTINVEVLRGHLRSLDEAARTKTAKYLQVLVDEMQRLNKVIGGLLDFAKPVSMSIAPTRLDAVLRDLADLIGPQAKKRSVEVLLELPAALPAISGDAAQLKQAFLNLVLNALHAMPQGGRLTLAARATPARLVEAVVADTGVGIAPAEQAKVFDLFYTTKTEGSGLGLAVVKRVVDAHAGKIALRSEPGRGTSFTLTFPAA